MIIWLISDTHFGHENMCLKFKRSDGTPARPFATVEEMDERLIDNWNRLVKPNDHIYHLGDVAMRQQDVDRVMPRLAGHKRLVRGNHDIFKTKQYLKYFDEIHGTRKFDELLLSHIPIAPWNFGATVKANVHGHVHLSDPLMYKVANPRASEGWSKQMLYVNVSCEHTSYAPVTLEQVREWVRKEQ